MTRGFASFKIEPTNEASDRDRRFVGPSVVKQTITRKIRIQGKRKNWRGGVAGSNDRGFKRGLGEEWKQGTRRRERERKEGEKLLGGRGRRELKEGGGENGKRTKRREEGRERETGNGNYEKENNSYLSSKVLLDFLVSWR